MSTESTNSFAIHLKAIYDKVVSEFESSEEFKLLESGEAEQRFYDDFIVNLCVTHLNSPQYFAFVYSLAPLESAHKLKENLSEELGTGNEVSHPELLLQLLRGAGLSNEQVKGVEIMAHSDRMRFWSERLNLPSLREFGLLAHLELGAFEWMLSKLSSRIGQSLGRHRNVSEEDLCWFTHHAEADALHAPEALNAAVTYAIEYGFSEAEFKNICEMTFRFNPFLRRYFEQLVECKIPARISLVGNGDSKISAAKS